MASTTAGPPAAVPPEGEARRPARRPRLEELGWERTPIGEISLRRRVDPGTGEDVYEVKLDDDYLMSSRYTAGEVELSRLALAHAPERDGLRVVVGGLGLGFTAAAVLDDPRVGELVVVDIDHSPRNVLAAAHAPFYTAAGTRRLRDHLTPGGVFALWSDDPPDEEYLATLRTAFTDVAAHTVDVPGAVAGLRSANTVYTAVAPA